MKYKWDKDFLKEQADSELINTQVIFDKLNIHNDLAYSILDIGCSNGYNTLLVFQKFVNSQILGIDIDQNRIDDINQDSIPPNFVFKCIDLQITNTQKFIREYGKFDIIYCSYVIQYLPNPQLFLEKCHILLKKNGVIIIKASDDNGKIFYPQSDLLRETLDIYSKYVAPNADRLCAEKCYTWLHEIGYQNITYNYFIEDTVNKSPKKKLALYHRDFSFRSFDLSKQCKEGLMYQRYNYLLCHLQELFLDDRYYYSSTSYIITAQR